MPLYEYTCPKCKVTQEQVRLIADMDKEMECGLKKEAGETCDGILARGLAFSSSFRLKGPGWGNAGYSKD